MLLKKRTKPKELSVMERLDSRMKLIMKDKRYYQSIKSGYEGELLFDSYTAKLTCDCLILNDLLLSFNHTTFQIDTLIIAADKVYLFEIKNFKGDYIYDSERLFTKSKTEIINPLHQLNRSKYLLSQLLLSLGFNSHIDASVVFINPSFTLYQAPLGLPYIFPTQVEAFLKNVNENTGQLNNRLQTLGEKLHSLHLIESPFSQLPHYQYEQLQKGMTCVQCKSFSIYVEGRDCLCKDCGHAESVSTMVLNSVEDFKLLFPNEKITTNTIHEWCKVVPERKRINRVLTSHYKSFGVRRWTYYE